MTTLPCVSLCLRMTDDLDHDATTLLHVHNVLVGGLRSEAEMGEAHNYHQHALLTLCHCPCVYVSCIRCSVSYHILCIYTFSVFSRSLFTDVHWPVACFIVWSSHCWSLHASSFYIGSRHLLAQLPMIVFIYKYIYSHTCLWLHTFFLWFPCVCLLCS